MIKISLPAKLAIQKAKSHGCKTVADAIEFIESDPGYENWVADDIMNTVQSVYGPNCPLDQVAGVSAFSYREIENQSEEGDGEGEGGTCLECGKKKPGKSESKPGDEKEKGEGQGDGDGEGEGEGEGEGKGKPSDGKPGEGKPSDGDGHGDGEGECRGHDGDGDGKGKGKSKPGGTGKWRSIFGKQWFTKDVLDSPFITGDFDGIAKEAREWKPTRSIGDRVNSLLSQIADLGGDSDDEPDRYHVGRLITRIATRQGGINSHCRRNERGRRKVLLLPDVSGSCAAFSASALEFCYSAAMVDERIVVIETFNGQIRMPGEEMTEYHAEKTEDERRQSCPFPFTKEHYEKKLRVADNQTMVDKEKNYVDWIMNGDFCAVIALGDTQGGWLYRRLDQNGMKVFWMDPGGYGYVDEIAQQNKVKRRSRALSLGRYAPLPPHGGDHSDNRAWYEGTNRVRGYGVKELTRYRNISYSVNMAHDVEGFIESLGLIIKEY